MCGIAGVLSIKSGDVSKEQLEKMTAAIKHRGPDDSGTWLSEKGNIGFAHTRLSIVDLSSAAAQPFCYNNDFVIVYNGELYNYKELKASLRAKGYHFNSQSDTEVVVAMYAEYRERCLSFFDGMFAFVIYNKAEETLFCARDRFGEKPFYFTFEEGNKFVFASEMKALWEIGIPKDKNLSMFSAFISSGVVQDYGDLTSTFYTNIKKLKPANFLMLSARTLKIIRSNSYWSIDVNNENSSISLEDASKSLLKKVSSSVYDRISSEVSMGSSLSGGIDSSIIVYEAMKNVAEMNSVSQFKTFSARYKDFIKDEGKFIDSLLFSLPKIESYSVFPDVNSFNRNIDKVCYHQEEPFPSSSIFAQFEVFELAKKQQVKVLLDGQGADELFAGYPYYFLTYFDFLERTNFKEYIRQYDAYCSLNKYNTINPVLKRRKNFLFSFLKKLNFQTLNLKRPFNSSYNNISTYLNKDIFIGQTDYDQKFFKSKNLKEILLHSLVGGELEDLLRYADRNSMANSVEVRLPYLSHELVEFVYSLPDIFKLYQGWTKYIERYAYSTKLPEDIIWRKDKIGFETPEITWLNQKETKESIVDGLERLSVQKLIVNVPKLIDKYESLSSEFLFRILISSKFI